jgi:hypothetical protein
MTILAILGLVAAVPSEWIPSKLENLEATASALKLGATSPFATLSVEGAFGMPAEALAIYVYWDASVAEPGRRRAVAVAKHDLSTTDVLWATSYTCSGLEAAVVEMEDITPPSLNVPGFGRHEELPRMVADGVTYTLSSRWPRWDDRASTNGYAISFSANVGNPLGSWAEDLRSTLSRCWSNDLPVGG